MDGRAKYCKDLGLEPLTQTEGISFCNEIYAENFEGEFSKTLLSQAANQLWSSKDFKNSYAIMYEQNEEGKLGTHMGVVNMTSSKECYVQGLTDRRSIKPYAICKAK